MTNSMRTYYAGRERRERAAAAVASSDFVRGVHLDLAERYAKLARHRRKLSLR